MTTTTRHPPPRPAYPGPFHAPPPPRRRHPAYTQGDRILTGARSAALLFVVLLLASAFGVHALSNPGPVAAAHPTAPVLTPAPSPPPQIAPAGTAPDGSTLVEGVDYAYQKKLNGQPVRWPCTNPITISFNGPTPARAPAALGTTVTTLNQATGLPLTITNDSDADISITYTDEQINGDPAIAGTAQTWLDGPTIISSDITLRADIDPTSGWGIAVLTHEISHALGLDHTAKDAPEVMAPSALPTGRPLGRGDLHALHTIGCHADSP